MTIYMIFMQQCFNLVLWQDGLFLGTVCIFVAVVIVIITITISIIIIIVIVIITIIVFIIVIISSRFVLLTPIVWGITYIQTCSCQHGYRNCRHRHIHNPHWWLSSRFVQPYTNRIMDYVYLILTCTCQLFFFAVAYSLKTEYTWRLYRKAGADKKFRGR